MCLAGIPRPPPLFVERMKTRRQERLMMTACVLEMLSEDEQRTRRGRILGLKNTRRIRKSVESMWDELGCYARKAYRMSMESFNLLHDTLEPALREEFNVDTRSRAADPNGEIPTKLRFSAALRYFARGSVYDMMLTHGIGRQSVYKSVYGIVNVVNHEPSLAFNADGAEFPFHDEQREIAGGFHKRNAIAHDC